MTKKLTPFTLPSSGVTIQTVPISLMAILETLKREPQYAEPEPPLVEVEIAGVKTAERNYSDPDFQTGYQIWEQRVNLEGTHRALRRIAVKQVLTDEQQAEVDELREALAGEALPVSDKLLWFYECALGNDRDIQALIRFVTGQADPQEDSTQKKQ